MPKDFLPKEKSVKLLCETFSPVDMDQFPQRAKRVEVLMRLFTAIDAAAKHAPHNEGITFNGERPNDHDALGAYIVNGGRLLFDMSKLSHKEQQWFANFIMPAEIQRQGIIYQRVAGTHRVAKKRVRHHKHGHSYTFFYEKRLTPLQSFTNVLKEFFGKIKPRHFGMDVGIGGTGNKTTDAEGVPVEIEEDGRFGHLYFNTRTEAIQFGFEEAAPLKQFIPGGGR